MIAGEFPPIYRTEQGFYETLKEGIETGKLGLDLEFSPTTGTPTIIGIASASSCSGLSWTDDLCRNVLQTTSKLIAYAGLTADKPIIEKRLNIATPLSRWDDPMIKHYLCNAHMTGGSSTDEDADDPSALGLMNLWTAASIATTLSQWKRCFNGSTWNNRIGPDCHRPCPVHNEEAYCALDAYAGLKVDNYYDLELATKQIPTSLYTRLKDVSVYCEKMQAHGVKIDTALVATMEKQIKDKKFGLFPFEIRQKIGKKGQVLKSVEKVFTGPFNPASPKAVIEYFGSNGIDLRDRFGKASKDKTTVRKALEKSLKKLGILYSVDNKSGELTLVDLDDEYVLPEVIDNLYKVDQVSRAGKGLKSWFDARYVDDNNFVHARFNPLGTLTGRLSSSGPNFQNIPARGFGALVRRVVIPRYPDRCIIKADYSSLEFRVCLWYAGYAGVITSTVFEELAEASQGLFQSAASRGAMTSRDVAKSVVHATNYLEGIQLKPGRELETDKTKKAIDVGALYACDGNNGRPLWEFRGKIVCFTGGNLSERLFGDRSYENRAKALKIQEIYHNVYPMIRQWHMKVSAEIENSSYSRTASGRYLELNASDEDELKSAIATRGQGGGADYMQEAMLNLDALGEIASMNIHDELTFDDKPMSWSDKQCWEFMWEPMTRPSKILTGFVCPVVVKRGLNWKDTVECKP